MEDEYTQWLHDMTFGNRVLRLEDYEKWLTHDPNIAYRLPSDVLGDLIKQGLEYKWMYDGLG